MKRFGLPVASLSLALMLLVPSLAPAQYVFIPLSIQRPHAPVPNYYTYPVYGNYAVPYNTYSNAYNPVSGQASYSGTYYDPSRGVYYTQSYYNPYSMNGGRYQSYYNPYLGVIQYSYVGR
jgi:hypothetical protein